MLGFTEWRLNTSSTSTSKWFVVPNNCSVAFRKYKMHNTAQMQRTQSQTCSHTNTYKPYFTKRLRLSKRVSTLVQMRLNINTIFALILNRGHPYMYSDFQASCNGKPKSVECHLHTLMCSVSVVTVVFIYTMEDDQRLNTLVHEGDALRFSVYHCKKPENRCKCWMCAKAPTSSKNSG